MRGNLKNQDSSSSYKYSAACNVLKFSGFPGN
nr:MAG TPA: hypothetical protein [Caudoviricetes sp.]